jgi:hypothetical protein
MRSGGAAAPLGIRQPNLRLQYRQVAGVLSRRRLLLAAMLLFSSFIPQPRLELHLRLLVLKELALALRCYPCRSHGTLGRRYRCFTRRRRKGPKVEATCHGARRDDGRRRVS